MHRPRRIEFLIAAAAADFLHGSVQKSGAISGSMQDMGAPSAKEFLESGARVKLSQLGRERSPRMTLTGIVVRAVGTAYDVLLDGAAIPVRLHSSYLEKAEHPQ